MAWFLVKSQGKLYQRYQLYPAIAVILLFTTTSTPALGLTHPPVQRVPGPLSLSLE